MEPTNRKYGEVEKQKNKTNVLKRGFVWRPVPSILSTTLCFLISAIVFIVIGAILLYLSTQIKEYVIRYDSLCDTSNQPQTTTSNLIAPTSSQSQSLLPEIVSENCTFEIPLEDTFSPPVMVYYQLENFYQDHRKYIKSKSINQLKGKVLNFTDIEEDCTPITKVKDLGINTTLGGIVLNPESVANPCGLMPKSLFNDRYWLFNKNGESIFINETDIAWESDKNGRYKRAPNYKDIQWTDVEDEHFMVWMRPAGIPDFRKLWGRINTQLTPGKYNLTVSNKFQVASFSGKKSFVLSTVSVLGGKNNFLGVAYLVVGCICLLMALLFWVGHKNYNNKNN
jgi:hypothetical protein